jgi:Flp pilus assembly protein TadG
MHQSRHSYSPFTRSGATVVELALVAPVFFLMIFGVIEFSRAVMIKQSLAEAARAGARTAALASTLNLDTAESAAKSHLQQTMTSSFDLSECRVSITPGGLDSLDSGTDVTASVEVDFNDVSWIVPDFMNNVVLRGEASMTRE